LPAAGLLAAVDADGAAADAVVLAEAGLPEAGAAVPPHAASKTAVNKAGSARGQRCFTSFSCALLGGRNGKQPLPRGGLHVLRCRTFRGPCRVPAGYFGSPILAAETPALPPARPLPAADRDTAPFWEGCASHELRAQRCTACGRFRWPPRQFCPACYSDSHEWTLLSGRGTLVSYSIVHHAPPAFRADAPYVVALVALEDTDGKVLMFGRLTGISPDDVAAGIQVQTMFDDLAADMSLPLFRSAADPS
ncbi:MAG: Zn-ribbon domain-containing OB-fold protein, partial [Chloroflexi bacterium]|nr:Zn-ribbon domain-containing OB-fold protein [Chloroflexota bacterium]